jgi:ribosome-associated heat shock protein Hsp15
MTDSEIRIDKYLWAIRMYKTRSMASTALEGGKVKLNGDSVKASKKVKTGEIYKIKREQQTLEIEVLQIIPKRVAASIATECYKIISNSLENQTKNQSAFSLNAIRDKGLGRPTKRERRNIDEFFSDED